ncbi:MAG: hypothetical protein HKN86_01735 [Acidimicrobiia bacterium]|nr:hypothetical protein [Acidimicrobiia bacterium]
MPAPILGLPALLQALATIGVGGAVGYKAQKDLQPVIKSLKNSPQDMDSSELKMLRALLLPNQAVAQELKDMTTSKSVGTTGDGTVIEPRTEDIEKQKEDFEIILKPPTRAPEPVKPYIEVFPGDPVSPPEAPVQPEIEMEKAEGLPDQSEELNMPTIFYNKTKDYEGPVLPTEKLDSSLIEKIGKYAGTPEDIAQSSKMPQSHKKKIFFALEEAIQEKYPTELSSEEENLEGEALFYLTQSVFDAYTSNGKIPNNVVMAQDEEGIPLAAANLEFFPKGKVSFYPKRKVKRVKTEPAIYIETIGSLNKDATENILNQIEKLADAQGIRYVVAEDLTSEAAEKAFEKRGFIPAKKGFFEGEQIKTADWRGGKTIIQKNMVLDLGKKNQTTETEIGEEVSKEQPQAPAIIGSKGQEGGKVYKDITAGISAQKDVVPSLLEQGQLAKPIKDFFESNNQVINYKIGDTIGAYEGDVERSLDIEAFVKPDFKIDDFAEVIKERAKQFNQDAVFVAESVDKNYKNANVGFSLDFGSNLQMQDALSVSRSIARLAEIDGFTFKTKNINYGDTSISLPQIEKDTALVEKTLKKYPLTEDIRKAGFIMPDGKMLNFNLRGGSVRDTEHRRVGYLVDDNYLGVHFGPMYDWMIRTGGVRVTGNQNRLVAELAGKPTTTQIRKIVDEYNNNRDKYDSLLIGVTIPGDSPQTSLAPRTAFGEVTGLGTPMANNLRKATFRLPMENFYEVNGEKANANDLYKRIQSTDIVGKTFTGIRQLNLPEFTNLNKDDALKRILNMENKLEEITQSTGIKVLDKPKTKFYNTKVFMKGKDY